MSTRTEYAIFDDRGAQYGLPAKTWETRELAQGVLDDLQDRRKGMEQEATDARDLLEADLKARGGSYDEGTGTLTQVQVTAQQDTVRRWEREKPRIYAVYGREVGAWEESR